MRDCCGAAALGVAGGVVWVACATGMGAGAVGALAAGAASAPDQRHRRRRLFRSWPRALTSGDEKLVVVPIRSGLGLRPGYNVGYLKFTSAQTWNPFNRSA
jgi:hypothetical protein